MLRELARSYLTVVKDLSSDESTESLTQLGDRVPAGTFNTLAIVASGGEDSRSWDPPASRATLSATGHATRASKHVMNCWRRVANASAAAADSSWDSLGFGGGPDSDPHRLQQAPTVDLQRI
jgi:hypothetical protein